MEPLSVGIHSVANIGALKPSESVVVFGAGPVGLLCMAVARALGASRVIAVDIVPSRLEFAKTYAATDIYLPPALQEGETRIAYSQRNAKAMMEQLGIEERGARGISLVVDASGAEVSVQTGIYIAKHGGRFVQVRLSVQPFKVHHVHEAAPHLPRAFTPRTGDDLLTLSPLVICLGRDGAT